MNTSFGDRLSNARAKAGLTQKQLAMRVGVSPQYLNDIEHDRRNPPSERVMDEISWALNIDTDILCLWAGVIPPDIHGNIECCQQVMVDAIKQARKQFAAGGRR